MRHETLYIKGLKDNISFLILGVNKCRLEKEDPIDVLMIDNEAVKKSQLDRLSNVKQTRDESKAQACLENLSQAAQNQLNDNNCLAAAVECARARCTVGEITDAMASVNTFGKICLICKLRSNFVILGFWSPCCK